MLKRKLSALLKSFPLLRREVNPWPGTVDVEDMPTVETTEAAARTLDLVRTMVCLFDPGGLEVLPGRRHQDRAAAADRK